MLRDSARHFAAIFATLVLVNCTFQATVKAQPAQAPAPPPVALPGDPIKAPGVAPGPRKETPEKQIDTDLRAFIAALNTGNTFDAFRYVDGARYGYFGATEWHRWWLKRNKGKINIERITLDSLQADSATVTVSYNFVQGQTTRAPVANEETKTPPVINEKLNLQRRLVNDPVHPVMAGGLWTITVPPQKAEADTWDTLQGLACNIQQPADFDPVRELSRTRLKSLGLAALQFLQDYEFRFAFGPDYFEEALMPYLPDRELFKIPVGQARYSFNARLCELNLNDMRAAAETPLFYDGQNEQLNYRYNGKAAVGFADGHVALLTPEDAKALKWQP